MAIRKGRITLEEYDRFRRNDQAWLEMRRKQDEDLEAKSRIARKFEKSILADLNKAGFPVASIWDLVNTRETYTGALPVLLKHLSLDYPPRIRDGIARSLSRPWARDLAWEAVLDAYRREPNFPMEQSSDLLGKPWEFKEGLAAALSGMAGPADLAKVIELVRDTNNGPTRVLLLRVLSRSRKQVALQTLKELASDPELRVEIDHILKSKFRRMKKPTSMN